MPISNHSCSFDSHSPRSGTMAQHQPFLGRCQGPQHDMKCFLKIHNMNGNKNNTMGNTQVDFTSWDYETYAWPPGKSNAITDDQLYLRPEKIVPTICRRDRIECRLFEMMPSGVHDIAKCTIIPPDNITFTFPSDATVRCLHSGTDVKNMGVPDMVLFFRKEPCC